MLDHRFLSAPRSARMRSNDRAVDNEVFHIRIIDEVLVHPLPDTSLAPSYKPLAFGFLADLQVRLTVQELENLGPLVWRKFNN